MHTVTCLHSLSDLLPVMSRADVEAWIAEREQPLIDELAALHQRPLPRDEQRARLVAIRDARIALGRVRARWRALHRRPDAGPDQWVGRSPA